MILNDYVESIQSKEDFVRFVRALEKSLRDEPEDWENSDLGTFLEAMAAWVEDMEGYYENQGEAVPRNVSWNVFGQILLAARVYE